nr:unnamed protein product [Callosobruchus analis]
MNYKHGYECLRQTAKHEGIRGLYAGTVPALIANTLEFSILFFAYGGVKKIMKNLLGIPYGQSMDSIHYATAGSIAAVFSSIVTCPTDVVKTRLQVQMEIAKHAYAGKKEIASMMNIFGDIWHKDGMRGMFKGLGPSLAKEVPGYFVYFYSYECMY